MKSHPIEKLSSEQQEVVDSTARAIVVVASAGSGKTEIVAQRVERLLKQSKEHFFHVLALSYTKKAANELGERFRERLGYLEERVDTNTIHGFAHSLLRHHGTRIGLPVDPEILTRDEDRAELLAQWLSDEGHPVPDDLLFHLHELDLQRARETQTKHRSQWEAALANAGALDYASMIVRAQELLNLSATQSLIRRIYAHIIVDEAHNLTLAQYSLIKAVIGAPGEDQSEPINAMLVGDDNQSIVSFAGGDPGLMKKFENEYHAQRFTLTKNFRSALRIIDLGDNVAKKLGKEPVKRSRISYPVQGSIKLCSTTSEEDEGKLVAEWVLSLLTNGMPEKVLADGESSSVQPEEIAVLARLRSAMRATEKALIAEGHSPAVASSPEDWLATPTGKMASAIVFFRGAPHHRSTLWELMRLLQVEELELNDHEQLRAALEKSSDRGFRQLAPLSQVKNPSDFIRELDQVDPPDIGHNDRSGRADWAEDLVMLQDTWKSFEDETSRAQRTWGNFQRFISVRQRGDDLARGVRLLTVHKAQGREFRAVALVGLNEGQFPDFRATTEKLRLAELRTFYVAITRPSRVLLLTRATERNTRYGPWPTKPSSFIKLIPESTLS